MRNSVMAASDGWKHLNELGSRNAPPVSISSIRAEKCVCARRWKRQNKKEDLQRKEEEGKKKVNIHKMQVERVSCGRKRYLLHDDGFSRAVCRLSCVQSHSSLGRSVQHISGHYLLRSHTDHKKRPAALLATA